MFCCGGALEDKINLFVSKFDRSGVEKQQRRDMQGSNALLKTVETPRKKHMGKDAFQF